MFALKEEGMEDEVSELLRTTKRFLGKSRVIGPNHISIQRISTFCMTADNGENSEGNTKVEIVLDIDE